MFIRRLVFVYGGLVVIVALRTAKRLSVRTGEFFKSLGRTLVSLGEDGAFRWNAELLLQCYMVDAEFHIGDVIYRGPVYAVYRSFVGGDALVFRCNWIAACQDRTVRSWEYAGAGAFRIKEYGAPDRLPNGETTSTTSRGGEIPPRFHLMLEGFYIPVENPGTANLGDYTGGDDRGCSV